MMQRLEESKNMEAEERARLEEEIRMKQEEVSTIYQQVHTLVFYLISLRVFPLIGRTKITDYFILICIMLILRFEQKKTKILHYNQKWKVQDKNTRYWLLCINYSLLHMKY